MEENFVTVDLKNFLGTNELGGKGVFVFNNLFLALTRQKNGLVAFIALKSKIPVNFPITN